MNKPRLLDLFCGAGGCAAGYARAGFEVVGVDHEPQPRFPFDFVRADALEYLAAHGRGFDAIHASPPCQGYSRLRHLPWLKGREWPMLIEPCLAGLAAAGVPWVVENVADAPLGGVVLCGRMFGLPTYRHRRFEASFLLLQPTHQPHPRTRGDDPRLFRGVNAGSRKGAWGESPMARVAGRQFGLAEGSAALGVDWMTKGELAQAVPPAYTEYVGRQLLAVVAGRSEGMA